MLLLLLFTPGKLLLKSAANPFRNDVDNLSCRRIMLLMCRELFVPRAVVSKSCVRLAVCDNFKIDDDVYDDVDDDEVPHVFDCVVLRLFLLLLLFSLLLLLLFDFRLLFLLSTINLTISYLNFLKF